MSLFLIEDISASSERGSVFQRLKRSIARTYSNLDGQQVKKKVLFGIWLNERVCLSGKDEDVRLKLRLENVVRLS